MSIYAIVIGTDRADAESWIAATPWLEPGNTEWVSPRSPHRVRGLTAEFVFATPAACSSMPAEMFQRLREEAVVCTLTRPAHRATEGTT